MFMMTLLHVDHQCNLNSANNSVLHTEFLVRWDLLRSTDN